jgi:hypothetical protein
MPSIHAKLCSNSREYNLNSKPIVWRIGGNIIFGGMKFPLNSDI